MQSIHRPLKWSIAATSYRVIIMAGLLASLWGCASSGKVQTGSVPERPSVTRLEDGRQGFIILEVPTTGADSRNDFDRAVAMMQKGDYRTASTLLEKMIEEAPGVTPPYINLALAYMQLDELEKAEEHLQTALQLFPEHPVASNEYGLLLRRTGRFAEARSIYEKTLAAFPAYHPARRNLGILCDIYLKDLECALGHYEIYSAAMPGDEQVKIWVADLRLRLGR